MKSGLSVCILGFGFMGLTHLKMYKKLDGRPNLVVVDNDLSKKSQIKKHDIEFFNAFSSALQRHTFDIVDICLPTYLHYDAVKEVLSETNAHIMVEKPLALNFKEAEQLNKLVGSKRAVMCAMVERFFEPMIAIKKWYSEAENPIQLKFVRRTKKPTRSDWFSKKELGGDLLLDLGIHDVDLLVWFTNNKIVSVTAIQNPSGRKIEVFADIENGGTANLKFGWDIPEKNQIDLINKVSVSSAGGRKVEFDSEEDGEKKPRFPYAYLSEVEHLVSCAKKNRKPQPDFSEAVKSMKVLDGIRKSLNSSGKKVFVN